MKLKKELGELKGLNGMLMNKMAALSSTSPAASSKGNAAAGEVRGRRAG